MVEAIAKWRGRWCVVFVLGGEGMLLWKVSPFVVVIQWFVLWRLVVHVCRCWTFSSFPVLLPNHHWPVRSKEHAQSHLLHSCPQVSRSLYVYVSYWFPFVGVSALIVGVSALIVGVCALSPLSPPPSLYLHKLGKAPQIEDLLGTATFTGRLCWAGEEDNMSLTVCVCMCAYRGRDQYHAERAGKVWNQYAVLWKDWRHFGQWGSLIRTVMGQSVSVLCVSNSIC